MSFARASIFLASALLTLAAGCGGEIEADGGGGGSEGGGNVGGGNVGGGGGAAPEPIDTPADTWTWVGFPGTSCIEGTETGIAINKSDASDNVLIFLEGGNACFNDFSCLVTANVDDGYDGDKFAAQGATDVGRYPYLDRTDPENPFKDYSMIYVPYCTGDLHAGERADVEIDGRMRQFHGFTNMTAFLERIVPTFPDADSVILTGISAGGFGAALNYDHVASAFGAEIKTTLIDDSGPPMADPFVPACLQEHLFETWGYANTLPADCADCAGAFVEPYVEYLLEKYPARSMALISSDADGTISTLLGFGLNDCANLQSLPLEYDPAQYRAGLENLRDNVAADSRFRLYMLASDEHVWLDNPIGSVTVEGVDLEDWLAEAVAEDPAWADVTAPAAPL
jgi:hypothetical protein